MTSVRHRHCVTGRSSYIHNISLSIWCCWGGRERVSESRKSVWRHETHELMCSTASKKGGRGVKSEIWWIFNHIYFSPYHTTFYFSARKRSSQQQFSTHIEKCAERVASTPFARSLSSRFTFTICEDILTLCINPRHTTVQAEQASNGVIRFNYLLFILECSLNSVERSLSSSLLSLSCLLLAASSIKIRVYSWHLLPAWIVAFGSRSYLRDDDDLPIFWCVFTRGDNCCCFGEAKSCVGVFFCAIWLLMRRALQFQVQRIEQTISRTSQRTHRENQAKTTNTLTSVSFNSPSEREKYKNFDLNFSNFCSRRLLLQCSRDCVTKKSSQHTSRAWHHQYVCWSTRSLLEQVIE